MENPSLKLAISYFLTSLPQRLFGGMAEGLPLRYDFSSRKGEPAKSKGSSPDVVSPLEVPRPKLFPTAAKEWGPNQPPAIVQSVTHPAAGTWQVMLSDAGVHILSFLPAARLELLALCCRALSPEYAARYESGEAGGEELGAVDAGARLQVRAPAPSFCTLPAFQVLAALD